MFKRNVIDVAGVVSMTTSSLMEWLQKLVASLCGLSYNLSKLQFVLHYYVCLIAKRVSYTNASFTVDTLSHSCTVLLETFLGRCSLHTACV